MKHIIRLAAVIFTVTVLYAQNTLITEKSFIVVRNGKEVTATYGGKTLSGNSWKDRKPHRLYSPRSLSAILSKLTTGMI